ncbi:hypothetical protein LguiB_026887 [Lonicera macranthoides]
MSGSLQNNLVASKKSVLWHDNEKDNDVDYNKRVIIDEEELVDNSEIEEYETEIESNQRQDTVERVKELFEETNELSLLDVEQSSQEPKRQPKSLEEGPLVTFPNNDAINFLVSSPNPTQAFIGNPECGGDDWVCEEYDFQIQNTNIVVQSEGEPHDDVQGLSVRRQLHKAKALWDSITISQRRKPKGLPDEKLQNYRKLPEPKIVKTPGNL